MSRGTGAWQKWVLVLCVLLVVGQIAAFFVIRSSRQAERDQARVAITNEPVSTPSGTPVVDAAVAEIALDAPSTNEPVALITPIDAPEAEPMIVDAPVEVIAPVPTKKLTKAELLEQKKREREEAKKEAERKKVEEAALKRMEQERVATEKANAAAAEKERQAQLERDRVAAEKAKEAQKPPPVVVAPPPVVVTPPPATPPPATTGSSKVLVYVLGPSTPSPSSDQLRNVFLGKSTTWSNGTTARPYQRPAGSGAGKKFYGSILKTSSSAYQAKWDELKLSGGGIEPSVISDADAMISKVSRTSGAFGYCLESELPADTSNLRLVRLK